MHENELIQTEAELRAESLRKALHQLAEAFAEAFGPFLEEARRIFGVLRECKKEMDRALERIEADKQRRKRHKLDFTRPIIRHQVIDRRPRLIRKVIH